ncbi:MAG: hypothetical protein H7Y33_15690 [Cytophagales bacterium]|nr:hypothetical protein [Rhizobacter sp.]
MNYSPVRPVLAVISIAIAGLAHADEAAGPKWSFSGFGTVAAVNSTESKADFTGNVFQPYGAGYTKSISTTPDSKVGAQVNAVFNSKLSAVLQVVSQYQHDSSYSPQVEWANVTFKPTSDLSLRLGRIALPSYLMSESRLVGYAHIWARPPQEVYGVFPLTNNDGVDLSYHHQMGGAQNTVQAYYGTNKVKISGGGTAEAKPSWGINDTVEVGSLTLRAAYTSLKENLDIPGLAPLYGGMAFFGETDMLAKYSPNDMKTSALALGANYDPGNWFLMGEYVDYKGAGILADSRSWYVAGGYRLGKFTPYAIHSRTKARVEEETNGGFLNGGINTTLYSANAVQNTTAVGLRFDAFKNTAIKFQYDRISYGAKSNGRLKVPTGTGYVAGGNADVMTLAVDFVF